MSGKLKLNDFDFRDVLCYAAGPCKLKILCENCVYNSTKYYDLNDLYRNKQNA